MGYAQVSKIPYGEGLIKNRYIFRTFIAPDQRLRDLGVKMKLTPLKELPKPLWPGPVYRVTGEPIKPDQFAGTIGSFRLGTKCPQCGGKGQVMVETVVGVDRSRGYERPITKSVPETCPKCQGEGVAFNASLYREFTNLGEQGLRLLAFPDTDDKALEAAQKNGRAVLLGLGEVGNRFRDAFAKAVKEDLEKGTQFPRGVVVFAQVRDVLEGTDGKYVVLALHQSATMLVMRAEPPAAPDSRVLSAKPPGSLPKPSDAKAGSAKVPSRPNLSYGQWIVLAGLLDASIDIESHHYLYIRPFDWALGPDLGSAPRSTQPGEESEPEAKPRKPGAPDLFGM
jgi:hypothetical protein